MDEQFEKDWDFALELLTGMLEDEKVPPEMRSVYCEDVRRFLVWWGEQGNPIYGRPYVSRKDVINYLHELERSLFAAELNRTLRALRFFFSFHYGFIKPEESPTWRIPNFWDGAKAYSWLDEEQQRQLEAAIDQHLHASLDTVFWQANWVRAAALVRFLLHTGLQSTEAQVVHVADIYWGEKTGMVHIRGKRERHVPLDNPTCVGLRTWLAIRPAVSQDWLWLELEKGAPHALSGQGVQRACRRIAQLADLDPDLISPHVLRNTCIYNLAKAGESTRVIKRLLRLKSIDTILRFL